MEMTAFRYRAAVRRMRILADDWEEWVRRGMDIDAAFERVGWDIACEEFRLAREGIMGELGHVSADIDAAIRAFHRMT